MMDEAKRARQIYEIFCKLSAQNSAKKRGTVMCCDDDPSCSPADAIKGFYNAILDADDDALETLILSALQGLTVRQSQLLADQLKKYCFAQQGICFNDQMAIG